MKSSFAKLKKWFKSGSFKNNAPKKISSTRAHLALESLEVRTLLAGNALNDGPNVEFQITEDWNSAHTAELVLANDDSSSYANWQFEFDYDRPITQVWNAQVESLGDGHYRLTPPEWDNTLDSGEQLAVGFVAAGSSSVPESFSFNGESVPGGNSPSGNNPGGETGDGNVNDPSVAAPNTPTVSVQSDSVTSGYRVTFNLWSGTAAESWKLFEDGEVIHEASLAGPGTTPQSDSLLIGDRTYGVYTYQAEVSNESGAMVSDQLVYVVGGASTIEIAAVDQQSQALQMTIDQGTSEYTLSLPQSELAQFQVATNNPRVVDVDIVGDQTLRVTGVDSGRASLRLTDALSGATRYIGIRVRTADGELPGLPGYLAVGSVSEDTAGDLAFWQDFDNSNPLTNKFVDSRYIYLNGGPVNGWRSWGNRVSSYLQESLKLGMIPQFVYYNIPDGGESYVTNNEHIQSAEYMEAYFQDLQFALKTIVAEAGDELVQFILEPDFIGYLMQNANASASSLPAMASAAYSSGVLTAGVDPQFDNTVTGLVQAINYTIGRYAPNVEFGWQFNLWASRGLETPIPANGIVHLTDTMGIEAGRAAIAREAELIAEYYIDAGVLSHGADFVSIDKYGLDGAAQNGAAADPAASTWFWNSDHWHNYLLIVKTLSQTTGRDMILWQIPVGHINDSLAVNPYDASGTFGQLENTTRKYEDSAPTFFLGDRFAATDNRFDYFSTNEFGDEKLTVSGSTITWGSHMEEARAAGVRQILFGAGVGISTDSIGSEPTDDYWWITQVQQYYQNPVSMDGSTIEPPPVSNPAPTNPLEGEVGDPASDGTIGTEDGLPRAVEGDYSGNRAVDAADYVLWRDTLGSLTDLRADGNGNGVVDQDDYEFWRERFGNSASETSPGPDPPGEPGPVEPPAIRISDATVAEGNSGNTVATFTVTLSRAAGQPVSVDFQTRSGTATAGEDYEQASGQVTFAASELSRTIEVRVFGDTMVEADEMFGVVLNDPVGAVLVERGANSPLVDEQQELFWQEFGSDGFMNGVPVDDLVGVAVGTILNNDVVPPVDPPVGNSLVQVENVTLYEGDSGTTQAVFTVSLSATSSETITVYYESQDGTATAGEDYQAVSGTLVFSPGETTDQVAVTIYGDTQFEANESFSLVMTAGGEDSPAPPIGDGGVREVELPTVAAYFPEWGIYGRNYQIADVPAEKLTHFIYAFANLSSGGEMVLFDSYAAVEKRFPAGQSVSGEADLWSYPADDPRSQQTVWGNFNQVAQLKAQNPHLRTSIALGGWTLSGNFSSVLSTPSGRQTLADSIYDFLDTYTMFDGIDFDWEYPGGGGLGGNSESPQDGVNYATLLSMVRQKLDQLGSERGRYYEISVASPAGSDKIANFNLAGLKEHVDFFNVMTYDFHGTWENTTGHQAALKNDPAGYDIETAIGLYLDAGVARENIVLGAPLYTRAWRGVADGGDNGYAESASGAAPGTFESGNYDYKDLVSQIQAGTGDWELNWDDNGQAAYLYSGSQEIFSSFETPGTIALKSEWAQSMGLGGMMFWDLSNDATDGESLINAASESWFEGKSFQQIVSASNLTFDNLYGGNGVFDLVAEAATTPTDPTQGGGEIVVTATGTILNDDDNIEVASELNYAEALQKSFLFYEANRSGDVDEATKRIDWRGDSGMADGYDGIYFGDRDSFSGTGTSNLQVGLQLDLTGGYHDAGDHGKFGLPLASTLSTLASGGIAFAEGYEIAGQTDQLLAAIRWGTDYLLKAHVTDQEGNTEFFVVQVGDVSADHALWSGPEEQTISRPAMAITREKPGSDVAGQTAAAMASASILFRQNGDAAYADQLLANAKALYDFADTYRGKYSDSITEIQGYYASWSGYGDDLTYGAAWLARAVEAAGEDGSAYREKALSLYDSEVGGLNNGWTHNWDDSSYAAAVVLAEDTGESRIRQDVESWLNNWVQGGGGVQITEGGLRFISQWGSLRYAANTALLAGIYADNVSDPGGAYSKLAQDTVDYILGDNPLGMSYLVGFGETFPQQPHHRAASGVGWEGFRNGEPNEHILYGALVGGPKSASDYSYNDSRDDYISNEVAIDYNAGLAGALARSIARLGGAPLTSGELDALPGVSDPTGGQTQPPSSTTPLPEEPVVPPQGPVDPPQDPGGPVMPPMDDHEGHGLGDGFHDPVEPPVSSGDYIDIATWGTFFDSNDHSEHDELLGGRTPITTEAMAAYNNLRAFLGLSALTYEDVGQWAFANELTNNTQAWANDVQGVGLYYAMQGAKVGWIADEAYDPQILADIQRTARLGEAAEVMDMVRQFGHEGYANYLQQYGIEDAFINTLKMEPHYGGWMHGRTHGWRSIEGVAIAHDVNHLTVLSHDQMQPFMNDTFDWPQWPALEVSHSGVIEYFQSMVVLGDPVGQNLNMAPAPSQPPVEETPSEPTDPPADPIDLPVADPVTPPADDHQGHNPDGGSHDPVAPPASTGDYLDITSWGTFHGSNHNSEQDELVGGRTAITTEAMEAYNNLRAFLGFSALTYEDVGQWAFANELTNNTQAWANDVQGVGLYYAMQGAKVGWIADEAYDPQILADIQRTARLGEAAEVMDMVRQFGHEGYADYLQQYGIEDAFINTLKMEPHYGGWMHGRTHGWRSIEGVAIAHDVNHLTVLSWDQMQPFMNDTFDWPQWPALDVSDSGVIEYFQSMVVLGDPGGENMQFTPAPTQPPVTDPPTDPPADPVDPPVTSPTDDHQGHNPDSGTHDPVAPPASTGDYLDITSWGTFHGSNHNSEHDELVGGRTAITTEAAEAYNNLRAFFGLPALTVEDVGQWAFANELTNNTQAWGNDVQGVGLYYAMQGAKVGWIADEAYDPQILADIQRTARLGEASEVMDMVRQFGHEGYADYLQQYGIKDAFINTLKMEPHYAGWMHGRTHGWRSIEGVAIAHDVNHLTVLSWDQMQPFMNDTFDWPQWPALDVSHSGVIEYFQSMVVLGDPVGQNLILSQRANRYLVEESAARMTDTQLAALLDAGKIAAEPRVGGRTPSDHLGALAEPLVTADFSQTVPSGDWWSSVHFAKFGDPFSAPLHVHPLTVQLTGSGLLVGAPAEQTAVVTGTTTAELKTPHQFDLQLDLFAAGQQASSFALDSYSDWSFTGSWQGNSSSTAATLALASPIVWLADVNLANLLVGFNTAAAEVQLADNVAQVAIAGRNYAVYAPEGISWTQGAGGLRAVGDGLANVAVALLPDGQTETRELFAGPAARPVVGTRFDYAQAADPYSLALTYQYDLDTFPEDATTVVAYYPHLARLAGEVEDGSGGLAGDYNRDGTVDASDYVLWSDTRGQNVTPGTGADGVRDGVINRLDYAFWKTHFGATPLSRIGEAGYLSPRGTMIAVATDDIGAEIPARGVLPNLPDLLTSQQRETLAQLVRSDPQANDPQAYLDRWQDTYWSGKSMLKMMQLAQMADVAGEDQIRSAIVGAVQNTLEDWFSVEDVPGDRHFAYNETWDTLQGYPDSFGSAGDLNDHHFHYGYFVHAAALVGIYDPSWVAENRDFVDVIIADVANVDASSDAFPRLRNFSPMAGHSWASGHGAFASGNNQESSSEAMNFATGVMLWGEVAGSQETTRLGQMLYSLEAEAISQYWFDKYGTTYPGEFDFQSVGMLWGDGAAHATWFSAEVEMIKGINLLPFHGGSLYLSEAAHDPAALLQEIAELNGGEPDVWQGLLLQFEALVDPASALAHYTESEFDFEEGQSPAHTYFWMTTLASLGSPTSAIRGDYALSAVFAQEGLVTYAAQNPTAETIDVHFSDGVTLQVAPYSAATTTSSELPAGPPADLPANDPADPGNAPPSLEDLEDGRTLMLVGQTFQDEYTDFIDGTGLTPAGSSHYATFYLGNIEQGDDSPNAAFLDHVRDNDLGDYAMVALSLKDNTPAGGYGQMVNQGAADFNSNAIWEALDDIRNGAWDAQIDSFAQMMASRPETQFLVRVGYEVSLLLFAYNGDEHVVDWLNQHANAGVNVFENPDALGELDRWAFIDAYNHIVDRIEPQAANVEFGYHPVRGFNDTQWLYPGKENVDWVGFSVFNNDVCMEVSGTFNCPGERIDPNLAMSIEFARQQGHEIVIAESTAQNPAASNSEQFVEYLDRLDDVVQQYDVRALVYINSDWPAHGWGPEWGDARSEVDPAVEAFFLETFGDGTRYVYADPLDNLVDPPVEDPGHDNPPADPLDPPMDDPMPPTGGPNDSYNPPGEEATYGFGLIEEGQSSAYDTTGFDQGEFVSAINFSHRRTADPLVDPGNPNFWHAHDFFVNPSTDAYSTTESLMAVDGSSARPANNESVYWAPSLVNETTGEYVTPLDSSIAYYRIRKPFDPARLEITPTGLSVIAGSAMPTERQSIGIVAWNYIGSSERYDHLPIGDEWQDLPLQALIYFPMFWDGGNLDSANHKSHMAYAGGNGGPSTHPYLLPELELQIHYGTIPQDAQLVLTSDYMTKDHPDYAPGWSLHADTIHLPWPEYDSDGNLYDGFERRVTDSMRFPIFAGTDGNAVRTISTGAVQPFTPEPFFLHPVFPGQDATGQPDSRLPILVSSTPAAGATDVPVGTDIVLVFDEPVVAGEGMIHLMTGPADDPKTSTVETHGSVEMFAATDPRVSINGNRVTINLANELAYDTTYHLDIGSSGDAFLDLAGNGYQRDHADYNFTVTDGVGVDFTIIWPGSDIWMGVGNTSAIYGQVNGAAEVGRLYAVIQNVETGFYQRTDGTFGEVDAFEITVNAYDGHWFFLHTPAAGGTYRVEVFATDRAANITSRNTTFRVHGDPPSTPADLPVENLPVEDSPVSDPLANGSALEPVALTTAVSLLVDSETQLAYVRDVDGEPILIRRSDDYWSGDIPLSRGGATLQAAARDGLGRLRVLDVGEWGPFAWILDESGMFIGEEGPTDSSVVAKEGLFQVDLNSDGVIGEVTDATPLANLDPGGDVVADGVQVRLMTFNVYYASLGAPERIDGIAQAIADYTPDIASIQEMWGEKDQILASVEAKTGLDYAFSVGSNTWDGDILYRADRWRILDDGVVTYDGSRGMSYATLEHLSTGEKMSVYGMHPLAGVSEDYHLRNIDMATAHMAARPYAGAAPIVLLGDMNAHENSESMRLIRDGAINAYGQDWSVPVTFEDTFRVVAGDEANGDTGFGVKIDYVYIEERADPAFRVEGASIRNDAPGGSDHFPVMAEIVLLR